MPLSLQRAMRDSSGAGSSNGGAASSSAQERRFSLPRPIIVYVPDLLSPVTCALLLCPLTYHSDSLLLPRRFAPRSLFVFYLRFVLALSLSLSLSLFPSLSLLISFACALSLLPSFSLSLSLSLYLSLSAELTHSLGQVNVNPSWPPLYARFLNQSRRHQRIERCSRLSIRFRSLRFRRSSWRLSRSARHLHPETETVIRDPVCSDPRAIAIWGPPISRRCAPSDQRQLDRAPPQRCRRHGVLAQRRSTRANPAA